MADRPATARALSAPAPSADSPSVARAQRQARAAASAQRRVARELARSLLGTVRDTGGAPVPGATVCTRSGASCCGAPQCEVTDARGRFELRDVPGQHDLVVASAAGYLAAEERLPPPSAAPRSLDLTLASGGAQVLGSVVDATGGPVPTALVTLRSTSAGASTTIVAVARDGRFAAGVPEGELDVSATAEAYSVAAQRVRAPTDAITLVLAPGAEIVGRVVAGDTDEGVVGVTLSARSPQSDEPLPVLGVSGLDGEFRLRGVRGGGWYRVEATSARWRSSEEWISLDVAQTSEPLLLRLRPATTLSGTVRRAGEACGGALVTASGPSAQSAYSSGAGQVRLEGLWPGRYQVIVYCDGALPYREAIEVAAQDVVREWDVDMGLTISGRVEGPLGEPAANVVVSVMPVGDADDRQSTNCLSGEDGEFHCSGLGAGEHDCYLADTSNPEPVRVSLHERVAAERVLLRTRPLATIQASVRAVGGDTAQHHVFARGADGFALQGIPRDGRVVFERLPLGRYQVYADLPQAAPLEVVLERPEQVVDVEVLASRSLSIEGRALYEDGAPVSEAWVVASPSDTTASTPSATYPPTLTDAQGEFTITGLARGEFDVHVRSTSGEGARRGVAAGATGLVVRVENQAELAAHP